MTAVLKLQEIRDRIAARTDDELNRDLDVLQTQIDAVLEAEEHGERDAGSDYEYLCLVRREMTQAAVERGLIITDLEAYKRGDPQPESLVDRVRGSGQINGGTWRDGRGLRI